MYNLCPIEDKEMIVDSEDCPKCGQDGEQYVYAGRNETLYTGTAECQECGHQWHITVETSDY